ncbi:MAG: hypothetical protein EP329_22805 [Deltaproteobacteria bacterium]|nr:MAG: hypothetical protein EP329_22805 [Deltaproteobacteria bacterium]
MAKFSERVEGALAARGVSARVVLTGNRVRMLSARRVSGEVHIRVAEHLAQLGDDACEAIVGWVTGDRGAAGRVRRLLAAVGTPPGAPSTPRAVPIEPRGAHHDLAVLTAAERARYFPTLDPIPVTWGANYRRKRGQRSVRLGSYDFRRGLVRIHRWLDHPKVPAWFIGFIVFHELLHAELGARTDAAGRRGVHTPEFRRREAQHHRYAEALAWEAKHLPRLLAGRL